MKLANIRNGELTSTYIKPQGLKWQRLPDKYCALSLIEILNNRDFRNITDGQVLGSEFDDDEVDLTKATSIIAPQANIWGAGLNFNTHASDLEAQQPISGPGSYLRPNSCLINNSEDIVLPNQSKRVTAEAELGLVIGKSCKNVPRNKWTEVVAALTTVLDMTAEDVIRENPRYIPWAKGFDTFCSIGPQLVTLDELKPSEIEQLRISTIRNGETIASAQVSQMRYDLGYLVEYFTAGRTLSPGTVICTGTPGAAVIRPGDVIEAYVEKVGHLSHQVKSHL